MSMRGVLGIDGWGSSYGGQARHWLENWHGARGALGCRNLYTCMHVVASVPCAGAVTAVLAIIASSAWAQFEVLRPRERTRSEDPRLAAITERDLGLPFARRS